MVIPVPMSTPRLTVSRGSEFHSSLAVRQTDRGTASVPQEKHRREDETILARNTTSAGSLSAPDSIPLSSPGSSLSRPSSSNLVTRVVGTTTTSTNTVTTSIGAITHTSILPSTLHRPPSSQMNRLPTSASASVSSTSTSVPLHALRSMNRTNMLSSESLQQTDGTEALFTIPYSHTFSNDSVNDGESSGRSLATNFPKSPSSMQTNHNRNLHDGGIPTSLVLSESHSSKSSTPGSASSSFNSYSQFISNASPRKLSEALIPPKTASPASTMLRYQQTNPTSKHGSILPARIASSDRTPSNIALTHKSSVVANTRMMPTHKAVRGSYHISPSSSSSNMHSGGYFPAQSSDGSSSLRSQETLHHHRSTGGLNSSAANMSVHSNVINVWSRDVQANKSKAARPSSSSGAQRPVTARANLLSMAGDDSTSSQMYSAAKTARSSGKDRIPHSTHVPPQTAAVGSSGAQARARSAFVLRPPSRQRPPNQALHLGGGVGSAETDRPINLSMSQSEYGNTGSARFGSKSGWSNSQLNPVVDLFPAAPVELVRAVKSAKRERTKNAFGVTRPSDFSDVACASLDHVSPVHLNQGSQDDQSASSDWDTEDTASIETDDGSIDRDNQFNIFPPTDINPTPIRSDDTAFGFTVGSDSSDSANVLASPSSFVSLHNILQLQAESGCGSRGKSRHSSASSNRKLNAHLHRDIASANDTPLQRPPATAQPTASRPQMDDSVYQYENEIDFALRENDQRPLIQQARPASRRVHKRNDSRSNVNRSAQPEEVEF